MSTVLQLTKRFREVLLEGLWIANTNFKDQLSDVSWKQAVTKVGSLNTIAMLTFHIDYYIAGLIQVLKADLWRSGINTVLIFLRLSRRSSGNHC